MALTDEEFKRTLEEYKEFGHEYRYREQMMVQEFSFSAVATAGLLNVLLRAPTPSPAVTVVLHVFGAMFLMLLALHLCNINQDRVATLNRKRVLSDKLEFEQTHLNVDGKLRLGAPRLIVFFAIVGAIAWLVWTVFVVTQIVTSLPAFQATVPVPAMESGLTHPLSGQPSLSR